MEDETVVAFMAEQAQRMKVSENRIKDLEDQNKQLMSIAVSVERLATNMESMLQEQKEQGDRLKALEDEPAQRWNSAKKTAFTTIVSVCAGALATGMILMIAQYIR